MPCVVREFAEGDKRTFPIWKKKNLSFNIDDVVTDFQQGRGSDLPGLSARSKRQIFRCVRHPAAPCWV